MDEQQEKPDGDICIGGVTGDAMMCTWCSVQLHHGATSHQYSGVDISYSS